jgi:hypothetical protein
MRVHLNEDENVSQNYLTRCLTILERMLIMQERAFCKYMSASRH